MDTQTSEASEQSTILSAATDDVDHSTISASPTDHVEQSTISASLTDHIEQPTISAGPTDHIEQLTSAILTNHIEQPAISAGLTDQVEQSTISAGPTDQVEQSTISAGLTDQVEQSTISAGLTDQVEQSTISAGLVDHSHNDLVPELPNHGGMENKHEIAEVEVRSALEGIASTGKYWHEWEKLKSMLSFYLKQVLSKYPEARMNSDEQSTTLGESYMELAKRLDDALDSFVEGPPFTIQRLSEILLGAQNIYPKLSKLALALEKNLLVTSTLSISSNSQPPVMIETPIGPEKAIEEPQLQSDAVQNGVEPMVADRDEIMADVETDADDDMKIDMAFEEIVRSSEESSAMSTGNS